jgi:peptidoglycan/xylan/chitin deacetylase (PgdA/CDA1 family)
VTNALIYHDVAPADARERYGFPGPSAGRYKVSPETFEAHLNAIAREGSSVGLVSDQPRAALTFDDGGASAVDAARALERHGWRGHFFITTGRIGTPGFLTAQEVQELADAGHDVGSHTDTHPTYMGALPRAEVAREWRRSRERLAELLGAPPRSAAVPGGFVSKAVIEEAAAAGYGVLMTSKPTAAVVTFGDLAVHGRYAVWARTSPRRVAAYARGDQLARGSLWLAWCTKNAPKRVNPTAYEAVRQAFSRRRRFG